MLSITALAADQWRYWLNLTRKDYYLSGGEPLGKWWGNGARHLGLEKRIVDEHSFKSLMHGFAPDGRHLVQNAGKFGQSRRAGFDLTFSAPKEVSALWAIATPSIQRVIQDSHERAVKRTLSWFEAHGCFIRTGKAGVNVHKALAIAALFEHSTSRSLQPQLHTHAILINVGLTADGRSRALVHPWLFQHKMPMGALYRAELAAQLERHLGITIEADHRSFRRGGIGFTIQGISKKLCELWSDRRNDIARALGERGLDSPQAAAVAAKNTRKAKTRIPPRAELFAQWREEAKQLGIVFDAQRLPARTRESRGGENEFENILAKTIAEMTAVPESDASRRAFGLGHFRESLLLRRLAENCLGSGFDIDVIVNRLEKALSGHKELVTLAHDRWGERTLSTRGILALESKVLGVAKELHTQKSHGVDLSTVNAAIEDHNRRNAAVSLGKERADALRYLTSQESGSIRVLEGIAGSAKTTTIDVLREIYSRAGYRVIGTAITGKAVREMRESGKGNRVSLGRHAVHHAAQIVRAALKQRTESAKAGGFKEACTLRLLELLSSDSFAERWKHHIRQVGRAALGKSTYRFAPMAFDHRTVIVCDEASMVDTRQMLTLVEQVRAKGALLILCGDRGQLQSLGPGGTFAHIADKLGSFRLTEIVRQRSKPDRQSVLDAARGDAEKVLKSFADRGLLKIGQTHDASIKQLVQDWTTNEVGRGKEQSLIFVSTNDDANKINRACQRARLQSGDLNALARTTCNGCAFHRGDRILFTANDYLIGVNNGELGTITAINPIPLMKTLTVKLDHGKKIVVPLREYKDIALGYAITTHKGQGSTVDRAYVLLGGPMQDRELTYVQVSRAREQTKLFVAESEMTDKALQKQMEKSNAKTLAHDVAADPLRVDERLRKTERCR